MSDLEMIDVLRHRMRLSYAEAKQALEAADGDLVQALINLERESRDAREQVRERGKQSWESLKSGLAKASKARIKVKQGEKVLFTLPAPAGAVGLVGALASTQVAVVGLLGTAIALANRCSLEIDAPKVSPQEFTEFTPHKSEDI